VSGQPGIGKTRLALAFRDRSERQTRWFVGRAAPGTSGQPLATVFDALPAAAAKPESIRLALLDAAASGPAVLWLDDLHAADAASQELVGHLGRNPLDAPLLVLVTVRTDALTSTELALTVGGLLNDGLAREVRVEPLGEQELAALSASVLGPAAVTADLVRWLSDRTRGNPLLLTAMLDDLAADPGRRSPARTVQERTRGLLRSLSPESLLAAEVAAVIGAPFAVSDLLAMEVGAASGLDRLVEAGLLVEDARTRRLEFAHPILQEAVYETIGPARRVTLHRRVGDRLPLPPGARAYHVARGALPGNLTAVEALREAASEATESRAAAVAVRHLQEAVRLVPASDRELRATVLDELAGAADMAGDHTAGIPALRELLALATTPGERITARLRLASFVSAGSGDLAEADRLISEAVALARAWAPDRLARALNELGWVRGEGGDLPAQLRFAGEALALAEARDDPQGELRALGPLTHALMLLGRQAEAEAASRRAVTLAEAVGDGSQIDWHLAVRAEVLAAGGELEAAAALLEGPVSAGLATADVAYSNHALHLWLTGRWAAALAAARRLLAGSPANVPVRTAWALSVAGAIEAGAGHAELARPFLALADRSYRGRGFYHFSALNDWAAGVAAWLLGELEPALARLQSSIGRLEQMGADGLLAFVLPYGCAVSVEAGALETGRRSLARAKQLGSSSPVARAAVLACAALADRRAVDDAAVAADAAGLHYLAALVLSTGGVDQVAVAARRYARMPAPALEQRCRRALRAAGGRGRRAARAAGSLTPREDEVMALARRGLPTARIAASLGIGKRTVETHLAHAYAKLGIAGRHEL
jgi:DNA-binding CsgD family transcriptional regulator